LTWANSDHRTYRFNSDPLFPDRAFAFGSHGLYQVTRRGFRKISSIPLVDLAGVPDRPQVLMGLKICAECARVYANDRGFVPRLVISSDGGKTWSFDHNDLKHALTVLGVAENQRLLAGSQGGGIIIRDAQGKWTHSVSFLDSEFGDIESTGNSALYALSRQRWLFASGNAGAAWNPRPVPAFNAIFADPQNRSRLIAGSSDPKTPVFYSFNGGASWIPSKGLSGKGTYAHVAFDPQTTDIVYLSLEPYSVVYKSADAGKNFHRLPLNLGGGITRILVDDRNSQTILFLSDSGVYKSLDGGRTARPMNRGLPCTHCARTPYDIIQLIQRDSYALLLEDGELLRTDNGGEEWKPVGRIDAYFTGRITSMDLAGQRLFALGSGSLHNAALYESIDGGRTWTDVTEQFGPDTDVQDMTDGRKPHFFVSTDQGIFTLR
jgi:photosystem II stability/assembly factor-like uncharacterized protein